MAPTSATPVQGAHPDISYQVGLTKYVGQSAWTNETINIPNTFIGSTVRIIFTWDNDSFVGATPAFSIDNVIVRHL